MRTLDPPQDVLPPNASLTFLRCPVTNQMCHKHPACVAYTRTLISNLQDELGSKTYSNE